jgi:hypothetical protein
MSMFYGRPRFLQIHVEPRGRKVGITILTVRRDDKADVVYTIYLLIYFLT